MALCGEVIRTKCIDCHGIDDYSFLRRRTGASWQKLIAAKHKPGEAGPFGSRSECSPRLARDEIRSEYEALPANLHSSRDHHLFFRSGSKETVEPGLHDLPRTGSSGKHDGNAEEAWRVTLVDMRERGAKLSDEELERLVEWLGRVWGTNQDK